MIILPNPCSENWNNMTSAEKGRFCGKCSKVVQDFSAMSTEEVLLVLRSKKQAGESVCGRFHASHLTPLTMFKAAPLVNTKASRLRVFLAALILVFSTSLFTSCSENPVAGNNQPVLKTQVVTKLRGYSLEYVMPSYLSPLPVPLVHESYPLPPDDIFMVQGIEPYYPEPDTTGQY